jgi:hypothetical protein
MTAGDGFIDTPGDATSEPSAAGSAVLGSKAKAGDGNDKDKFGEKRVSLSLKEGSWWGWPWAVCSSKWAGRAAQLVDWAALQQTWLGATHP